MKAKDLIFDGDVAYVPLTRGYYAIIDAEDAPLVEGVSWRAKPGNTGIIYAARDCRDGSGNWTVVRMHRVILGAKDKTLVDHLDHDGLNNRRNNIRLCSHSENNQNARKRIKGSSKYKGIYWKERDKKWYARIMLNGKRIFLGSYDTEDEAHKAYCKASRDLHKEFGCTASDIQINQHRTGGRHEITTTE